MIVSLRAPEALFSTERLRAGGRAVRGAFVVWLVVKAGETLFAGSLPAAFAYADAALAAGAVAFAATGVPSAAFARAAVPWCCAIPAAALPAALVVLLAHDRLAGTHAAPDWAAFGLAESFVAGVALTLAACGGRSGVLACVVNAAGTAFGVLIGLGADLGAIAATGTPAHPPALAAVAAAEAALWPMTLVAAGTAPGGRRLLALALTATAVLAAFALAPRLAQRRAETPARPVAAVSKANVVRGFYDDVSAGRYPRAYGRLSAEFQRGETPASFAERYAVAQRMIVTKSAEVPGTNAVAVCIVATWRDSPAVTTYGGTIALTRDAASSGWRIDRRDLARLSGPSLLPPVLAAPRAAASEAASPPPFDPSFCSS
ncbi:MAG TPA: hypothetical protein VK665_14565 [Candidatus Elarobacter sp.]|nr:hypothetical protein [Candidatus Elarobacter sp.]